MKIHFPYSKIASIGVLFMLVIQTILVLCKGKISSNITSNINYICQTLYRVLWIVLFALIAKKSVKNSPLVKPSCIAGAGYILLLVSTFLFFIARHIANDKDLYFSPSFLAASIVDFIATIAIFIGFIQFSKVFTKGSPQQLASVIIPIVFVANALFYCFFTWWGIESKRIPTMQMMQIYSIIKYVTTYGSAFFFMFSLTKLKE